MEPDAGHRYLLVREETAGAKRGGQAGGAGELLSIGGLAPPILHSLFTRSALATRLFNVTVTNVPGPQLPLYAFGARMEEVWPLVPLAAEHSLGVAVASYDGKVFFGLNADERATDVATLARGHRSLDRRAGRAGCDRPGFGGAQLSLHDVPISPVAPERMMSVLEPEQALEFETTISRGQALLGSRVIWNVSSTARGGGVAEMLASLLAYTRGAGLDARWVVIEGSTDFFRVTKRIHNMLHGSPGDGVGLGDEDDAIYRDTSTRNARELVELVRPGDVVLLHDPQTAGLIEPVRAVGAHAVWRCHVGVDDPNGLAEAAWEFLRPHVLAADAVVFSREAYVWEGLDPARVRVIPPSIDAFSAKNQEMEADVVVVDPSSGGARGRNPSGTAGVQPARRYARAGRSRRGAVRIAALARRRPGRDTGLALGPPQGPDRRSRGLSRRHRADEPTPTSSSPGPQPQRCLTIPKGSRCSPRSPATAPPARLTCATESTSSRCRWRTSQRTPPS